MQLRLAVAFALLAVAAASSSTPRQQMQDYLASVYAAPSASDWTKLSDTQVSDLFNKLSFYYPGYPTGLPSWNSMYPQGRTQSHPYAGTECNCLHIQLSDCKTFNPSSTCAYWPVTSYINLDWVAKWTETGIPSNSWYEGLSFPGEWAFPQSCNDQTLSSQIYGFHNHVWLYPTTGVGVWWNTGNTAAAWNKVDWLIKYGSGKQGLGTTTTQIMDKLADTVCPGYQTRGNSNCEVCPYSSTGSTSKCCCHGSGRNLGCQVIDVYNNLQSSNPKATWDDALTEVAGYYQKGLYGQGSWSAYPKGTFFCYRNLLDPFFIAIQASQGYDTVQFTREPQHSGGSGTPSEPAYAFEVLAANNNWNWDWQTMCQDTTSIGVLNPLDYPNYADDGYISSAPASAVQSISVWKPRADFLKLLTLSNNGNINKIEGEESVHYRSGYADEDSQDLTAAAIAAVAGALVVAGAAFLVVRRRRAIAAATEMQVLEEEP